MKKLFAFISVLAVALACLFAEVTAKKNSDGSYEVSFFYGNPRATEVLVAGDFTNWQNGALPMTKGDKGFSVSVNLPASTEAVVYKFISDGNWTADLRAPVFIDDGFGGKNSKAELADLVGGDDNGDASKAKIVYSTWTMLGTQGQFATGKGDDAYLDNMTLAAKSYNKFGGMFLPNAPFYIELAVAENELEGSKWRQNEVLSRNPGLNAGNKPWGDQPLGNVNNDGTYGASKTHYLYKQNNSGHDGVDFADGIKDAFNGILTNPAAFFADTNENWATNPFLGHLKFGWNTPYVNFLTGFNYAKPDTQKTILWTTVDGGWDAGYKHVGGFSVFSLGEKLTHIGDATVNFTFAPNKSADRKGFKYGLWTFANVSYNNFAAEVQYNGFYLGDGLFYKPFEQDIIFGAKNKFGENFSIAAQMAFTLYDNYDEARTQAGLTDDKPNTKWLEYRGFACSVPGFADKGNFDFIKHTAGEVKAAYTSDILNISADYRYRGAEQNLLFVTDHHSTGGKTTQTDQLGKVNTQRITLDATVKPTETLSINVIPYFETVLSKDDWKFYHDGLTVTDGWGTNRNRNAFESEDGKRFAISEKVDFDMSEIIGKTSSVSLVSNQEFVTEDEDKFVGYDSKARLNNLGVKFSLGDLGNTLQGIDIYYGLNNNNDVLMFNTLIGSLNFKGNTRVDAFVGIRSFTPEVPSTFDLNHPFGFGVGVSKQLKRAKKPTVYAQFVYDMDPYNEFGDGQDNLNLSDYGAGDHYVWAGNGDTAKCDAVNYYYGAAAVRMGIRWSF